MLLAPLQFKVCWLLKRAYICSGFFREPFADSGQRPLLFTIDQPIQLLLCYGPSSSAVGEHIWSWRKPMIGLQRFGMLVACLVLLKPQGSAQDLARYRDFEFGMTVDSVVKRTKSEPSSMKTLYTKPELLQTLQWNRQGYFSPIPLDATDPVQTIRFDFFEDRLFRIVAVYATKQLAGMSSDDLIEAISKTYGPPTKPGGSVVVSSYADYEDEQKVLARWENGEYTYSLFRSSYRDEFGLVAY
jgi:hypothetical protein